MTLQEAKDIISGKADRQGFFVAFEVGEGAIMRSDYFPDFHCGETGIPTEHEAWELAGNFARKRSGHVNNVYVVDGQLRPVSGYKERMLLKA